MSSPVVEGFLFDEVNEEKFSMHGLSYRPVLQILDDECHGEYHMVRNRRRRRGLYLLIGRDHGGQRIAVPIEPTHDPTVWRPITAWPCKQSELRQLERE